MAFLLPFIPEAATMAEAAAVNFGPTAMNFLKNNGASMLKTGGAMLKKAGPGAAKFIAANQDKIVSLAGAMIQNSGAPGAPGANAGPSTNEATQALLQAAVQQMLASKAAAPAPAPAPAPAAAAAPSADTQAAIQAALVQMLANSGKNAGAPPAPAPAPAPALGGTRSKKKRALERLRLIKSWIDEARHLRRVLHAMYVVKKRGKTPSRSFLLFLNENLADINFLLQGLEYFLQSDFIQGQNEPLENLYLATDPSYYSLQFIDLI